MIKYKMISQKQRGLLATLNSQQRTVEEPHRFHVDQSVEQRLEKRFIPAVLRGELCIQDAAKKHLYVRFRKGPYLTVGRGRWPSSPAGFCLNNAILSFAIDRGLEIRVLNADKTDRVYVADAGAWRKFNVVVSRKGVTLHCYPWSKMLGVRDDPDLLTVIKLFTEGVTQ